MVWQLYTGGVINHECDAQIDHAVLLVGWGEYPGMKGFNYFVKNSWGNTWGLNGYVWVGGSSKNNAANKKFGMCGILACNNIPVNNEEEN